MNNIIDALVQSAKTPTIEDAQSWWVSHKQKFLQDYSCELEVVPLKEMNNWEVTDSSIRHETGRFFSILPYRFERTLTIEEFYVRGWDQPIINQPEIGFLGFLTFIDSGVMKFIVQSKIEPGNEGYVQLSPTIQATRSNFELVHGGKAPDFLDFFRSPEKNGRVLYDQIQSEQGSRFFRKRNRNMVVCANSLDLTFIDIDRFSIMTLKDIKNLMGIDNVINMDTRTVVSNLIALL